MVNMQQLVQGQNVYSHEAEYYSATKKNELVRTWINLRNTVFSE